MKKRLMISCCLILTLILLCGTIFVLAAEENPLVGAGETHEGDFIGSGTTVTNDGLVVGDILAVAQTLSVRGDVEGDIIAGAFDISVSGKVGGSVRVGGNNVTLASTINRNVMAFGTNLVVAKNTVVNRNAYLFGNVIKAEGTVLGNTDIFGSSVTVGGSYQGNVVIHGMTEGASFQLAPGTIIKGKLTYKGVTEFKVPSDVQVGSYEFVKINPVSKEQLKPQFNLWTLVKEIFTIIIYYLFALLLYKLFPRFFVRSGDFIGAKPLSAAGIGIATLGSLVGGLLLLFILLLLTIFILKVSVSFFAGFVFIFIATLTIVFADLPVSLWLGTIISRKNMSVPARLAIGLTFITVIKLALDLLGNIQVISTLAGVLSFLFNAFIWVLGTGALLRIIFDIFKSANLQADAEETEVEPISF